LILVMLFMPKGIVGLAQSVYARLRRRSTVIEEAPQ